MTGDFPAQHDVKWTLEDDMSPPKSPQQALPLDLPNLATVMAAAGCSTPFKGKFHLTRPANKTERFVNVDGSIVHGQEGTCQNLKSPDVRQEPFFLVAPLVNPDDVLADPNPGFWNGYTPEWLKGDIDLPETVVEDLFTKPSVQNQFLKLIAAGLGNSPPSIPTQSFSPIPSVREPWSRTSTSCRLWPRSSRATRLLPPNGRASISRPARLTALPPTP